MLYYRLHKNTLYTQKYISVINIGAGVVSEKQHSTQFCFNYQREPNRKNMVHLATDINVYIITLRTVKSRVFCCLLQ